MMSSPRQTCNRLAMPTSCSTTSPMSRLPPADHAVELHRLADVRAAGVSLAPLSLAAAHAQTGLAAARAAYGLTGRGQTVAVIDTGIAFDHTALARAGVAASSAAGTMPRTTPTPTTIPPVLTARTSPASSATPTLHNPGVATGVDLVALRVFADNGSGYFHLGRKRPALGVPEPLRFRNPITTVNLSLGTVYNGTSAPPGAQLEEEFEQLKTVGIFVAVAAGNDFTSYGAPGLSLSRRQPACRRR